MQLTCSHHEFSLHHYMGTLQEHGSCDYWDAINMHGLTETHTHTQTHAFIQMSHTRRSCITSDCSIVKLVAPNHLTLFGGAAVHRKRTCD